MVRKIDNWGFFLRKGKVNKKMAGNLIVTCHYYLVFKQMLT